MDPSNKPLDLFSERGDDVPSKVDKGKRTMDKPLGDKPSPVISTHAKPPVNGVSTIVSDSEESVYQSVEEEYAEEESSPDDEMGIDHAQLQRNNLDLVYSIKGMYRVFDLIMEWGSGGLVDKIIISQDLQAFVNSVCPGAYTSMTNIDFKTLDNHTIKPVGIYGSKEEIVRFLLKLGVVDDTIAMRLLVDPDTHGRTQAHLRSGLYIIKSSKRTRRRTHQIFVLYWPEHTAWDDFASPSVCDHRVMFMRYLTKMCDQIVSLISSEHAQTILWCENESEEDVLEVDQDESDLMFTFEVAQTNVLPDSVTVRQGFKAVSSAIARPEVLAVDPEPTEPGPISPFLLYGETVQGFMTVEHREARVIRENFEGRSVPSSDLERFLTLDRLRLAETLDDKALEILVRSGIEKRFQEECTQWRHESTALRTASQSRAKREVEAALAKLNAGLPAIKRSLFEVALDEALRLYPCFDRSAFTYHEVDDEGCSGDPEPLSNVLALYPRAKDVIPQALSNAFQSIPDNDFQATKDRIDLFKNLGPLMQRKGVEIKGPTRRQILEIVLAGAVEEGISEESNEQDSGRYGLAPMTSTRQTVRGLWKTSENDVGWVVDNLIREATKAASQVSNSQFLSQLDQDVERYAPHFPEFKVCANKARQSAFKHLAASVVRSVKELTLVVHKIQTEDCEERINQDCTKRAEEELCILRVKLIKQVNDFLAQCKYTLSIDNVEEHRQEWYDIVLDSPTSYQVSGSREWKEDPFSMCTVYLMKLTAQDRLELQSNSSANLSPQFKFCHTFRLRQGYSVVRAQLLEDEKLLLVLTHRAGNIFVFLDRLEAMDCSIARLRGKILDRGKIGEQFVLTYDESNKLLAVVSSDKLNVFVFDDSRGFQALGSTINLQPWFNDVSSVPICHACFVSGSKELLLIDSQAKAKVLSLDTLQLRPTELRLGQVPYLVASTPDGACLLVAQAKENNLAVTAYHWGTFGSTAGIPLDLGPLTVENRPVVTSLINRTAVHVVVLDLEAHACRSHALDITCKVTDFTFREKSTQYSARPCKSGATLHNCLIDCHAEVWARFPVLPAAQRETIPSSTRFRSNKTLVFVTDRDYRRYAPRFADMVLTFERATKKQTGGVLKSIQVSAVSFAVFAAELCQGGKQAKSNRNRVWNISAYRAGEWLVGLLCLIPINIALVKEDRFVLLRDGVYSPDLEKSSLGMDANQREDCVSFGWYESLFQSYMASKPVRVVSSMMGEQLIGKSFALNHLVDTSFAGSAMSTTEGVWMSVTPTEDSLIVALDFEAVHGTKMSEKEDKLLFSFSTAISNLVLFGINIAASRDMTGLFRSFQSNPTVLDPKEDPSLFQSMLVIIVKDVVDRDRPKITKEFSLEFQRTVQDEQEANFVSRLHAGKLSVIPWPVIESRDFYKPFAALERQLDKQVITHRSAGEFLCLMKRLVAELKAKSMATVYQSMASYRAQLLSIRLANALAYGYAEIHPEREPLKNLDTDVPINLPDTPHQFFIGNYSNLSLSHDRILTDLWTNWEGNATRQNTVEDEWTAGLQQHLETIVNLRIAHVRAWLDQNLSCFQAADGVGKSYVCIDELKQHFESSIVTLRDNVQLCGLTCAACQLCCLKSRVHDGAHDCRTNHLCVHACDFCLKLEREVRRSCTMSAGHAGKHICDANQHLCDKVCKFSGRHGCQEACTKVVDHTGDEHLCAAPIHACGKPCGLIDLQLANGSEYSCPGTCRLPSDVDHSLHQCDSRFCPIQCQLCRRLCADQDHMHGLNSGVIHLCGQEHLCSLHCSAPGICEINTEPHEATFTGRNETFQYMRYRQVAKRLRCIKPIPPGTTKHKGSHTHSPDKRLIHFCDNRCENCGYFCTLPVGHSQQEHETRHGVAMSHTLWSVDSVGVDGVPVEIERHKFTTDNEGPMMCNLVCSEIGRHVHVDYCRAENEDVCTGNRELQHLKGIKIHPNPDRPKDLITHSLFWKRSGFKDPYSRQEQVEFAKCDAMCEGLEHTAPSYCVLPLFHAPLNPDTPLAGAGYISSDGHQFACQNPSVM